MYSAGWIIWNFLHAYLLSLLWLISKFIFGIFSGLFVCKLLNLLLFIFFQIYLPLWKCLILIPVVYIYIPLQFSTSLLPYLCFNFALLPCFFFFCLFVNILLTRLSFFYIILFVFCTFCVRVGGGCLFIWYYSHNILFIYLFIYFYIDIYICIAYCILVTFLVFIIIRNRHI